MSSELSMMSSELASQKVAQEMSDMSNDDQAKNRVKKRNFSQVEDALLSKAYVNVSSNPIKGTGQKSNIFWSLIKEAFDELYEGREF